MTSDLSDVLLSFPSLCSAHFNPSFCLVSNYNFDKSKQCIGAMTIEIDFLQKKSTDSSPYDSDKMAAEFIQQFNNQAFSVTQQVPGPNAGRAGFWWSGSVFILSLCPPDGVQFL